MNNKPKQQSLARDLYFNTNLSQAAIATYVGVSKKTICLWVSDGNWMKLREAMQRMPSMLVEDIYGQLQEITHAIRSRGPGQRFATWHEADVMRKLVWCSIKLKQASSMGENMENVTDFCRHVRSTDPALADKLITHAESYMQSKLQQTHIPTEQDYLSEKEVGQAYDNFDALPDTPSAADMLKDIEQEISEHERAFKTEEEFKAWCDQNHIPYFPTPPWPK